MKILLCFVLLVSLLFCSCSTYVTPRYSISADTNVALKSLGASGIAVGTFSGKVNVDYYCRAAGRLAPPDGMTHAEYIKKALEDELKVAGVYTNTSPRVTLSGTIYVLDFSSARGVTGGSWHIDMLLKSSNGRAMPASESYGFESGFDSWTACKQTAEAYMPAVQNLIRKIVRSPEFRAMVASPENIAPRSDSDVLPSLGPH